jgi:hypothetical protein
VRTHCSDIAFSWLRCWKCGGATIRVRIPVCICIVEGRRRRYAVQAVQHGDVEQRLSTPSGLRLLGASGERAESGGAEGLFLSHSRIRACLSSVVSSEGIARIAAENRILHGSSLATRPTWAWPDRDKPQIPTRWFWRFVSSSWCRAMPCSRGWPGVR